MKRMLRERMINCLPSRFREWCVRGTEPFGDVLNGVANISYSQQGEDLAIERYFKGKGKGFYVDVGAYHPTKYSNTFKLYRKGWSGINIDANPDSIAMFELHRGRDANINVGISETGASLTYTKFSEPTLNTFDPSHARIWADREGFSIIEQVEVPTRTLSSVLDDVVESGRPIDLMNIDVEGLDLQVLRSNDWHRYRPELLLVECNLSPDSILNQNPIVSFLSQLSFRFWECAGGTMLFVSEPN